MIKHFISLEWKSALRSPNLGKTIGTKTLMVLLGVCLLLTFFLTGWLLYPGAQKMCPDKDPLLVINGLLFYWILGDLVFRFFFQKLPVMLAMPLLILPVKRAKIVNYVLGKSALSFFNFLPLFLIVPFAIALISNNYPLSSVLIWVLALIIVTQINNQLNYIIESFSAKTELSFLPIMALSGVLYGLNHFNILSFGNWVAKGFNTIYNTPICIIVLVPILVVLYLANYRILHNKLFLDSSLKSKVENINNASNLEWTNKFGDISPFMQLDLKLIWRNKRTKSTVWMLALGLLYGLFIYVNPEMKENTVFYIFVGIFSTGIFLINFGQFIPAWDSSYYKLLMSQNIKYEQYLKSKFTLMTFSVIILFILGIPYVYFGWKVLFAHFASAIYNIGVNTHIILWGGSYNRKKIDLNQKAAFNYQGTGAVQWLIGIPLLILPMGIFAVLYYFIGFEMASLIILFMGTIGIVFHKKLMVLISNTYIKSKYKMIDAFAQDN